MKTVWEKYLGEKMAPVMSFSEGYKNFLNLSKTEREAVNTSILLAEKAGFKNIDTYSELKAGDRVYVAGHKKTLLLFTIGKEKMSKGMNVLGAHIDSPRIDVKQNPLYEDHGLVLMDTHYYGGIKKYQWVAQPLALHGVVCKKDGSVVEITIGEDESDPVIEISDLLIHLSRDQMKKTADVVIEGEDLNALVASIPAADAGEDEKDPVKKNLLNILAAKYGIEEKDFESAELEIVPAGKARDLGLDRGLVLGYGHDDRICAYTSLMAALDVTDPERTTCCILSDKEEVGSMGNSGMSSRFFENTVAEVMNLTGDYNELNLRRCLSNSFVLSSDVSAGFDPNYPQVNEMKNTSFLGKGIVLIKFCGRGGKGGTNDANPEYIAKVRRIMDDNDCAYQTAELGKVDMGGGGTIAYILANLNMEVMDAGIAVQNMHAMYEAASKVDIYEAYRAYSAFLRDIK